MLLVFINSHKKNKREKTQIKTGKKKETNTKTQTHTPNTKNFDKKNK